MDHDIEYMKAAIISLCDRLIATELRCEDSLREIEKLKKQRLHRGLLMGSMQRRDKHAKCSSRQHQSL